MKKGIKILLRIPHKISHWLYLYAYSLLWSQFALPPTYIYSLYHIKQSIKNLKKVKERSYYGFWVECFVVFKHWKKKSLARGETGGWTELGSTRQTMKKIEKISIKILIPVYFSLSIQFTSHSVYTAQSSSPCTTIKPCFVWSSFSVCM